MHSRRRAIRRDIRRDMCCAGGIAVSLRCVFGCVVCVGKGERLEIRGRSIDLEQARTYRLRERAAEG